MHKVAAEEVNHCVERWRSFRDENFAMTGLDGGLDGDTPRGLDGDTPRESLVKSPFAHSGWVGMTIDSVVAI